MQELWQLYDESANPIAGKGAAQDDVFDHGLLHGASHVWIWRKKDATAEILLQMRASTKRTWPNRFDISAAGHIDINETPKIAALREAQEEIGLNVNGDLLKEILHRKIYKVTDLGAIENEFQWIYLLELKDQANFLLQESEVTSLKWQRIEDFENEYSSDTYVPHGNKYYLRVIDAIKSQL